MSLKLLLLGCLLSNLDNFFINVFGHMVSYWILLLADELYVELDTYIDKGDTNQKRLDFVFLSFFSFLFFLYVFFQERKTKITHNPSRVRNPPCDLSSLKTHYWISLTQISSIYFIYFKGDGDVLVVIWIVKQKKNEKIKNWDKINGFLQNIFLYGK